MEVKGEDKFLLRAKTAPTADKSELSAEYFTIYNELKALAQQEIKALVAEKDIQIRRLENMVMTALERPSFYAETYNNQGDTMPKKESNFNLQGAQFGGGLVNAETVNAHQIGGNITNNNSELTQAAAQIQQLLEQLEQTYPSNTTTGKMAIATEAIKYIESDRALAQRVLSALKVGGTEALAQLLNHPAASFVIGALEDWQKTKES